jgi:antitoxin (DNA-binding transcriptional repressor) of toxin-antitoxin stability system
MLNVSMTEFESHLSQIFSRVEAGEDTIITRLGEPIIRLSAVRKPCQALPKDHKQPENTENLLMTREKLDDAVETSKRILKEAAHGKLPRYI